MNPLKRLLHRPTWHKLPMLPRMYSTEYALAEVERDTQTLMQMTQTRCPQGVQVLMRRHGAKDARTLIETLPPRKRKRRLAAKAASMFRSAFGLLPYDPLRSIARQQIKRGRRRA